MAAPQVLSPHDDDVRVTALSSDMLATINRSEIEQQVEIARKYRRSIDEFRTTLEKYATLNEGVALSMFYSLKRRKADGTESAIVGPSVRFAEALVPCWRNCRAGVRILGEQGSVIAAQGIFFDCETNTGISVEANRSIVGSKGNRYSADMIVTTGNAAASVAYRNAVIRAVPRALWLDIYEKAKLTAVGKAESFGAQVMKAVEEFSKQGVTQVALLNTLGASSIRDINADHILAMRTMFREIRDGEKTIEDVFGSREDAEINSLMAQLEWSTTKQRMSLDSFKGKRSDHLVYLRAEVAKTGKAVAGPNVVLSESKPPQEEPASPPKETVIAPEEKTEAATQPLVLTGEAEKPAAAKPNRNTKRIGW